MDIAKKNHYLPQGVLRDFWGEKLFSYNLEAGKQGKERVPKSIMYEECYLHQEVEDNLSRGDDSILPSLLGKIRKGNRKTYLEVLGSPRLINCLLNLYVRNPRVLKRLVEEVDRNTPVMELQGFKEIDKNSIVLGLHLDTPIQAHLTFFVNETDTGFILPDGKERRSLLNVVTPFLAFCPTTLQHPWVAYTVEDPSGVDHLNVLASLNAKGHLFAEKAGDLQRFPFSNRAQLLSTL